MTSEPFADMRRRFDEVMTRARERAAALDRATDELTAIRGVGRCPDGNAEAVVDHRGALVSLWLDERVVGLAPERVGALIVATTAAAALDAARRRNGVIGELVDNLSE